MIWDTIFENLVQYGIAGTIAGALLYVLSRTLKGFMQGLREDRSNYMRIIEGQKITQENHMNHLTDSIDKQSRIIAQQGERYAHGVEKICDNLERQTKVFQDYIKDKDVDNG